MPKNKRGLLTRRMCMDKKEVMVAPPGGKPLGFFGDVRTELKKVIWPSRQQLLSESFAVLLMVVASTLLIYLVDALFVWLSQRVFP